jgi:hypothetical protein
MAGRFAPFVPRRSGFHFPRCRLAMARLYGRALAFSSGNRNSVIGPGDGASHGSTDRYRLPCGARLLSADDLANARRRSVFDHSRGPERDAGQGRRGVARRGGCAKGYGVASNVGVPVPKTGLERPDPPPGAAVSEPTTSARPPGPPPLGARLPPSVRHCQATRTRAAPCGATPPGWVPG